MGAAAGEGVVAEVDYRVALAAPDIGEHMLRLERRVGGDGAEGFGQQEQRLVAERTATIQPADVFLLWRKLWEIDCALGP
jgi:hypothetical protein